MSTLNFTDLASSAETLRARRATQDVEAKRLQIIKNLAEDTGVTVSILRTQLTVTHKGGDTFVVRRAGGRTKVIVDARLDFLHEYYAGPMGVFWNNRLTVAQVMRRLGQ